MPLSNLFKKRTVQPPAKPLRTEPNPPPVHVVEVQAARLIAQVSAGAQINLLDCREPFERAQMRIPGSLHIAMNDIPARLSELDAALPWVVVCAHGHRSYSVADYLLRNGIEASSLAGGITDWALCGGTTESDFRR